MVRSERVSDLCAGQVIQQANRPRAHGLLSQGGRVFATHVAHEGNPGHEKLEVFANKHG